MKARKRNSNDEWRDVQYVQLRDSYVITQADQMEFQHDTLSTELKTYDQMGLESQSQDHWQDVRERAAIAAMQGTITILGSSDRTAFRDIVVEGYKGSKRTYPNEIAEFAVACADALVKRLKKEEKEE